ncbi:MAG: AAA family ATPase [Candidatus Sedimenticola sp. (ex Thyasira tokunagai)]
MKLNQLSLAHYRGFEQLDIAFEPDVTVIAGINGVGKSALLSAIVRCLSHTLRTHCFSKESPIGMAQADIKTGKDSLTVFTAFNYSNADVQVDISRPRGINPDEAKALAERRDEVRFAIRETKKGSIDEQNLEDEIHSLELKLTPPEDLVSMRAIPHESKDGTPHLNATNEHPIAVYYSTARFLSRLPPVLPKTKGLELATAYVRALDQLEISLNDFANWYRVLAESEDSERSNRIFQQLENAISVFLGDVKELRLHSERPPRFSVQKNGETFYLEQLSDGERGLLALVFDLTRRLATANPSSNNPIAEGTALVMIDEIELHLHPKWQRKAIRKLREVFKNCQFIITTHSPQVIGQVKAEKLRLLSHDENGKVVLSQITQAFGMDSSWVLQNIMGTPARDYETEQLLSKIFDAIDEGKYGEARELANEMRAEIGDFPDLQEAVALLDRFELLGQG